MGIEGLTFLGFGFRVQELELRPDGVEARHVHLNRISRCLRSPKMSLASTFEETLNRKSGIRISRTDVLELLRVGVINPSYANPGR